MRLPSQPPLLDRPNDLFTTIILMTLVAYGILRLRNRFFVKPKRMPTWC